MTTKIDFRCDKSYKDKVDEAAGERGVTVASLIRKALEYTFGIREDKPPKVDWKITKL